MKPEDEPRLEPVGADSPARPTVEVLTPAEWWQSLDPNSRKVALRIARTRTLTHADTEFLLHTGVPVWPHLPYDYRQFLLNMVGDEPHRPNPR